VKVAANLHEAGGYFLDNAFDPVIQGPFPGLPFRKTEYKDGKKEKGEKFWLFPHVYHLPLKIRDIMLISYFLVFFYFLGADLKVKSGMTEVSPFLGGPGKPGLIGLSFLQPGSISLMGQFAL